MIHEWINFIRRPETRPHIVFLSDYDMLLKVGTKGRQHVYKEKTMKKADCRMTASQFDQMVNHEAGLLGVSRTRTWQGQ